MSPLTTLLMPAVRTAAVLMLVAVPARASASDANLARNLAATCANCHGTNGHALPGSGLAALAGEDPARLLAKLAEFRKGERPATIMHQIAKGYSDEQLALIAGHFATQPAAQP